MAQRLPYNPFEELNDFPSLRELAGHIVSSLEVKKITVLVPQSFDVKLIHDPDTLVPVFDILVGDATFNYIIYKAEYVLNNVKSRIERINANIELSYEDKFKLYNEVKKNIIHHYQYFNSMNPIRYMSSFKWKVRYSEEKDGKVTDHELDYVVSKIDLKKGHWNFLENTLLIRRHMLYEILNLIDVEIEKMIEELSDTKYEWKEKGSFEIYELLLALLASGRVDFVRGDERTFIRDFLSLFSLNDQKYAYSKGKVLDRETRTMFLQELSDALEKHGKPSSQKS